MRVVLSSDEQYPVLNLRGEDERHEPHVWWADAAAVDLPDELVARWRESRRQADLADRDVLRHLAATEQRLPDEFEDASFRA